MKIAHSQILESLWGQEKRFVTALAPMQDVTTEPFMNLVGRYGPPDLFFTEYFRVHASSVLEPHILRSITHNETGRPVFAQMIGESIPDLIRTAEELRSYPIAGVDLNLGCPAPRVYKKNVGGGLLRDVPTLDRLLKALRAHIPGLFTVKMRIGFDHTDDFESLLSCARDNGVDLLSLHGRTVKELYRSEVHYDFIARAVEVMDCPVLANGNITSVQKAMDVLKSTKARGVMVGRSAIRNPWIFRQLSEAASGGTIFQPTLGDVRQYVEDLFQALDQPGIPEFQRLSLLKKFLNFVGQSIDPEGQFLYAMRRTQSLKELFDVVDRFCMADPSAFFALEPYPNVVARPNCEV
jgi:tRNA-dihydrouridine synthase B